MRYTDFLKALSVNVRKICVIHVRKILFFFSVTLLVRGDKALGIGQERAKAGIGTKINTAAAVFGLGKIIGVCAEDASANGDEGVALFLFGGGLEIGHGLDSNRFSAD